MTENNDWPDPARPGVPLNPELDGWHWLKTPDNEVIPFEWRVEGECERGRWPSYWVRQGEDCWTAEECEYIGLCLTANEAAALQKRCEEAERTALQAAECHAREMRRADALRKRVAELEKQNAMLRHEYESPHARVLRVLGGER